MIYLVVGLDQRTLALWRENVRADDAMTAKRIALAHAEAQGIKVVVAAVIGPNSGVVSDQRRHGVRLQHAGADLGAEPA